MKKIVMAISAGVILFSILCQRAAAQEEQWLQYASSIESQRIVGGISNQGLSIEDKAPAEVGLPEFKNDKPIFAQWKSPMVKGGGLWVALDSTKKNGSYDLLYIDSNGDGNLKDETAITTYRSETMSGTYQGYQSYFNPAKVILEGEDGPVTYHLNSTYYTYGENRVFYVYSGCWYEGTISADGEKKYCLLLDYNANGTFDDKGLSQHDRIRIGEKDSGDTRFVGKYLEIDEQLYELEVARDGAYVKLKKAEDVKYGDIEVQEAITKFSAGGENGLFDVKLEKGAGKLPAGQYRIENWQIERKDDKNNKWRIEGMRFGDKGILDISEGGRVKVDAGEPVISILEVAKGKGNQYTFNQKLSGRLGESITLYFNDNPRPRPPRLLLKSKDGKFDKSFAFEYG